MTSEAFNTIAFAARWRGIADSGLNTVGGGPCQEPPEYLACILLTGAAPDSTFALSTMHTAPAPTNENDSYFQS